MRQIALADLPDDAVSVSEGVATFELPNPDDPLKPIIGTASVVGESLHLFPDRSSTQKRFLAYHNL